METRIIWCISAYQSRDMLEKSVPALPRLPHDLTVIVDGAYAKWPHQYPYSTDGTVEYAKQNADIVIETRRPWRTEWEKRNSYFIGGPGDYYIVIDSDEIWTGPRPELGTKYSNLAYHLYLRRHRKDDYMCKHFDPCLVFRVYRAEPDLYIYGAHNAIWKGSRLLTREPWEPLPDIMLEHMAEWRSKEYLSNKGHYYEFGLREDEDKFRLENPLS